MAGYLSIFIEQLCLLYACYFIIGFFLGHTAQHVGSLFPVSAQLLSCI